MVDSWYITATAVYLCQIGILSVAFSLNFVTDKIPNYALGGIIGTGHLIGWTIAKNLNYSPYMSLPAAFFVGGIINSLLFTGIIDKSQKGGTNIVYLVFLTIGAEFVLTSFNKIWWYSIREQTSTISMSLYIRPEDPLFLGLPVSLFVSVALIAILYGVLKYWLPRTMEGTVFVAVSENPELASIQGFNISRVKAVVWFISGGLACVVGAFLPLMFHSSPSGTMYLVTAGLVGCILGGGENLIHVLLGGILLGGLELGLMFSLVYIFGPWIGEYRPIIPILVLAMLLYFTPEGIFTHIQKTRRRRKSP